MKAHGMDGRRAAAIWAIALAAGVWASAGCYGDLPVVPEPGDTTDTTLDDVVDSDAALDSLEDAEDTEVSDATDAGPEDADIEPEIPSVDPCDPNRPGVEREVVIPLGETLFFDGDDFLPFWGADHPCEPILSAFPLGGSGEMVIDARGKRRLTPDLPGDWVIDRGPDTLTLVVDEDWLTPDTFLNYNYSPVQPIARVGDQIWVASPVSNAVQPVKLNATGGAKQPLIPTGSWPTSLAWWQEKNAVLVTQTGRDTLGFIEIETGKVLDAIRVGNEPANVIIGADADDKPVAWVALSGEDRVALVDLETAEVSAKVDVGRDPRAMVHDPATHRLFVASLISLNAHPFGPLQETEPSPDEQRDIAVIDTETFEVSGWIPEIGTIIRGMWLDPASPGRLVVAVSHSDNTIDAVDATKRPHRHALVVVDVDPASETALQVLEEIDLDHQPSSSGPAASPFSLASTPNGDALIATLSAGSALLVLDPATGAELTRVPTGSDPRGLVFAGNRMWTYAWLDNQLQSWDIPSASAPGAELTFKFTRVGADPTSSEVKAGQRMFNDASFSARREFSCNNCHIDGLTDGLVWDILADGPVNTIAFRNVAGTSPFLWGGQLPTLFDFSREVLKLVGANASGSQMADLTTYMQSVTAPPNPYTLPGGAHTEAAIKGRALFESTVAQGAGGCAECHSGTLLTNQTLQEGKTPNLQTDVPSLYGAYDTGPWGRQGQWRTLRAMVEFAVDFTGATLSTDEMDQLEAFVREQPADQLYLTSTIPLNGAHHVWRESHIELSFSDVLASNQDGRFAAWQVGVDEAGAPVESVLEGAWTVAGRFARFVPTEALALNTEYVLRVAEGLESRFGSTLEPGLEVSFTTGGEPTTDVSGTWNVELCEPNIGCAKVAMAFVQSDGGQVTGVIKDNFSEGEIDHLEGVVDGMTLALDPFAIQSDFGPLFVEDGMTAEMQDTDGDGFADTGSAVIPFTFAGQTYLIDLTFERATLPED